jgi:branched-subunit amino acid ABC-type transport system permease component
MGLVQNIIFGLVEGSYIAIAAIGFTLIYGIIDMINFAYGEYMTIGAFVGYLVAALLGASLPVVVVLTMLIGGAVGYLLARGFFTPLREAGSIPLLLTSIGVGMILRNAIRLVGGAEARYFPVSQASRFRFEFLPDATVFSVNLLGDFFVTGNHLTVIVTALGVFVSLHLALTRSRFGIAMRAMADNEDLALVTGIDTDWIRALVWIVSGALAGLAGVLLALQTNVSAGMGFSQLLPIIAAAILGGAGSPYGAILGAYLLGIIMSVSVALLPTGATQLGTTMSFVVLIAVLLVRPNGIIGREVRKA